MSTNTKEIDGRERSINSRMEPNNLAQLLGGLLALWLISAALWHLLWTPHAVARRFARQGIRGPAYRFIVGSLPELKRMVVAGRAKALDAGCHNYASLVYPFVQQWASDYGKTFLYWIGPIPAICSIDLGVAKQVLADRTDLFQKDYLIPSLNFIFGKGVIFANGDDWRRHRKVVYPVFNKENLESMSRIVSDYTRQMMERWCAQIQEGDGGHQTETDMRQDAEELTVRVIEQVVVGAHCEEVREAYLAGKELQKIAIRALRDPPIPGFRYLPTRRNRRSWQLNRLITSKIMKLIEERLARGVYGDDLLGLMLEARRVEALSTEEIIDDCKSFFVAGSDTSGNILTWGVFLLCSYPEWQEKVREEVYRECKDISDVVPSDVALRKLKLLNMCLLETLRLYSPVPFLQRKTAADTTLANIKVPKGTMITIPVPILHRDKEVWGDDADQFNPTRFENGVARAAKDPHAMLAFSYGPRVCAGQSFAMVELQIMMAMILRRFSFSLSPKYVHKPSNFISLVPRYAVPIIVKKLHDA